VQAARWGNVDILKDGIDLRPDSPAEPIEVVMSRSAASIRGVVTGADQRAARGARVVLVPEGSLQSRQTLYQTTVTDQRGFFALFQITPGEYSLYAWDRLDGDAYLNEEWRKPYEVRGLRFKISERQSDSVELKLISVE
jgi:hypothetical protein